MYRSHNPATSIAKLHLVALVLGSCALQPARAREPKSPDVPHDGVPTSDRPPYQFHPEDLQILEDVQRGCFNYLWNEVGEPGKLAKDRRTTVVASTAGIGFQLSAIPIGVEHGWITRRQGEERALTVLRTLTEAPGNRRDGVFLHFVRADDGQIFPPYNNEISTVDHTLLLAGAMSAATYFGGETAERVAQIAAQTNWQAFAAPDTHLVRFAWKPANNADVGGEGKYMDLTWHIASDEERLLYFIATGSPTPDFAIDPRRYYELERNFVQMEPMLPFVASWNGALFTYFFSHCWINYRDLSADDPGQFAIDAKPVDWFENSRRATLSHRQRCLDYAGKFRTLAPDRWGLSPCMGRLGDEPKWDYLVQDVLPNLSGQEQLHRGTVAPYAAGSAILFTPIESMAALRAFHDLKDDQGKPIAWRDPHEGGYALVDSFNLDQQVACDDNIAIDVGPMLLAIENARTGLIWRLFMQHPHAVGAVQRLKWVSR